MRRNRWLWLPAVALALSLPACAQKSDVESVQAGQKEILATIEKIAKDQAALLARVQGPAGEQAAQVGSGRVYQIPIEDSYVRGPRDAPVTIVEFSDFQCPYCAQAAGLVDQVLQAYPKDVNFVYKNYPLPMHPNAEPAARASLAAGKQGKFWEMHDEMFKNSRDLSPQGIRGTAEKIGLDLNKFEADMRSDEIKQQVQRETREGQNAMARGTPSFFINGKVAPNRSLAGFKAQIDEELKKKKAG